MACCAALAIVLAFLRTVWSRMLGRAPAEDIFPPAATWRSSRDLGRPTRQVPVAVIGPAIGRPLAATVLAYALLVHLFVAMDMAQVDQSGISGWVARDVVLAAVAIGLLLLGRHRMAVAPALVGVGAVWFALGVIDMHVFTGFEVRAVPLVLDVAFHLSGWWLAVAAAGVALVQRRQGIVSIGALA